VTTIRLALARAPRRLTARAGQFENRIAVGEAAALSVSARSPGGYLPGGIADRAPAAEPREAACAG